MMQLSQVANAANGVLRGNDVLVNGVSINSRTNCEGRMFVALNGENFDAHDYIEQAVIAGAVAAVVERDIDAHIPTIKVADSHQALSQISAWWRGEFDLPVIGVTGSVGKTSVKEMLGAIFSRIGRGVVTHGNLNNEIGVPLTLMRLSDADRYAIVEMGMNHSGEISRISTVVQPTIALINNAAAAHLEGLGSIEAVADAKGEIFDGLSRDGIAVINLDDRFADKWLDMVKGRQVVTFALDQAADVTASYKCVGNSLLINVTTFNETVEVRLSAIGEHNVRNAIAAIATAMAAQVPMDAIRDGLELYRPISGRLNIERVGAVSIIDDTYNANPLSMKAAIDALAQYSDTSLIIGDMGELGESAAIEHEQIGRLAAQAKINTVLVCGEYASNVAKGYGAKARVFNSQSDLLEYSLGSISSGTVLVKGSRFMQMENVVKALTEKFQNKHSEDNDSQPGEA